MDILSIHSLGYCLFGQLWRINLQTENASQQKKKKTKKKKKKNTKIVSNKSRKDLRESSQRRIGDLLCTVVLLPV
jgi:ABC-type sulfate transport system substrate-binding protein